MSQHFLLTSSARTLSLASVMRMSDEEAEQTFVKLRWSDNDGNAFCSHCGCLIVYSCRRGLDLIRWHRQKAGTIEHAHDVLMNELAGAALPSQKFGANAAWLRLNVILYNLLSAF